MSMRRWIISLSILFLILITSGEVMAIGEQQALSSPAIQIDCDVNVDPDVQRIRYNMTAALDWTSKIVEVTQTVHYRNDHNEALTTLVFYSEPHRLSRAGVLTFNYAQDAAGHFLNNVTIDNDSNTSRIAVQLPHAVASGCDAVVTLRYAINVLPYGDNNPLGWLAYTEHQLNLGHWFPTLGIYDLNQNGMWYTPRVHYIGEQFVAEVADIDLTFSVSNGPAGLTLAAPGTVAALSSNAWRITHTNTRELGLSLSTAYTVHAATVGNTIVEWYIYSNPGEAAVERAMTDATQSVELFSRLFGPYPHERLVVVEGDGFEGLELTGFLFVGTRWFEIWNGNTIHWLTVLTVHEIAHQWWYASVSNDQGTTPFMDEALATYSEYLYFEEFYPAIAQQWWSFRVDQYTSTDNVDVEVHQYTQWRPYINAVYLNGARMLHAVRTEIGDDAFTRWLSTYYADNLNTIANPTSLWAALGDAYVAAEPVLMQYLGVVLPR